MKTGIKLIHGYQTSETTNGLYASFVISSMVVSILLPTQKNRDIWAGFELWHFRYFSNLIINAKLAVAWTFLWSITMQWCYCYAVPINAWVEVWGGKEFLSGNEEKKWRPGLLPLSRAWNFHQMRNTADWTCSRLLRSAYRSRAINSPYW